MYATYITAAAHPAISAGRQFGAQRGHMPIMLTTSSAADTPHSDSSTTCPMLSVVSTEYHEKHSAITIIGTTAYETTRAVTLSVSRALCLSISAHWATKQTSAMVATERPTATLDSHVLNRVIRGTSKTGTKDLKAHPKT